MLRDLQFVRCSVVRFQAETFPIPVLVQNGLHRDRVPTFILKLFSLTFPEIWPFSRPFWTKNWKIFFISTFSKNSDNSTVPLKPQKFCTQGPTIVWKTSASGCKSTHLTWKDFQLQQDLFTHRIQFVSSPASPLCPSALGLIHTGRTRANSNANPLMLLACKVNTSIHLGSICFASRCASCVN